MIYLGIYALIGIILCIISLVRHWDCVEGETYQDDFGIWKYRKWSKKTMVITCSIMTVLFVLGWPLFFFMAIKDYRRGLGW